MTRKNVKNEYFTWLFNLVCANRYSEGISYKNLLMYLHDMTFRYLIEGDANRADDGVYLRYRFMDDTGYSISMDDPCSVLEMLVALSVRCEENIMDDPLIGDRTGQWFWGMIVNLGLGYMTDDKFDGRLVKEAVETFLNRKYEPNGVGGLFTIRNCPYDLREVEIWHQLCWYLDSIT
jgi:hypothetical protein